jgi:hypothetical protein
MGISPDSGMSNTQRGTPSTSKGVLRAHRTGDAEKLHEGLGMLALIDRPDDRTALGPNSSFAERALCRAVAFRAVNEDE